MSLHLATNQDVVDAYERKVSRVYIQVLRERARLQVEKDYDFWLVSIESACRQQQHSVQHSFFSRRRVRHSYAYTEALQEKLGPDFKISLRNFSRRSCYISLYWNLDL